ncbi:hypothetical protein ACQ4M3_09810 [Leptolyngbya sp. AN03gr2]|uniref:hypothetical protein n=1 Tax=Leptolyngbya sp. AN03gr2 TaxID=3423364 RepID=UPI003D311DB6
MPKPTNIRKEPARTEDLLSIPTEEFRNIQKSSFIYASTETITPELARRYLELVPQNQRSIKPSWVQNLVRRLKKGEWQIGDPAKIDREGNVIDAQHRFTAIAESGVTVEMVILRGYPPESMQVLDLGRRRNADDVAKVQGVEGFTGKGMLCPWFVYDFTRDTHPQEFTEQQRIDLYLEYKEGFDFACEPPGGCNKIIKAAVVKAIIARAFYFENHLRLREFVKVLATSYTPYGEEDKAAHTLVKKYEQMIRLKATRQQQTVGRYTLNALQAFMERRPLTVLKDTAKNLYPHQNIKIEAENSTKLRSPKTLVQLCEYIGIEITPENRPQLTALGKTLHKRATDPTSQILIARKYAGATYYEPTDAIFDVIMEHFTK